MEKINYHIQYSGKYSKKPYNPILFKIRKILPIFTYYIRSEYKPTPISSSINIMDFNNVREFNLPYIKCHYITERVDYILVIVIVKKIKIMVHHMNDVIQFLI